MTEKLRNLTADAEVYRQLMDDVKGPLGLSIAKTASEEKFESGVRWPNANHKSLKLIRKSDSRRQTVCSYLWPGPHRQTPKMWGDYLIIRRIVGFTFSFDSLCSLSFAIEGSNSEEEEKKVNNSLI